MTEPLILGAAEQSPDSRIDNLQRILDGTGFRGWIGEPPATLPNEPYWCAYPAPGRHMHRRYGMRGADRAQWVLRITCAARTLDGLDAVAQAVANRLIGQYLDADPSTSPVTELWEPTSPIFAGPPGDRRCSTTLTLHYHTRSTPNV